MRSRLAVSCRLLPLILALIAALPQSALALTASQVYEQVKDSVVVVKAYNQKGEPVGLGSGVMLPSGDIITNFHVIKAGVRYTVGRGKQAAPATLKAGDPDKDLCLLTAPSPEAVPGRYVLSYSLMSLLGAEPARLGKAARLKVGDAVYAVGAPQGLELSLSEGIVSQLRGGDPPIIQTTVAISPGSSGGGLFNAKGELVGITTFRLKDGQSLNFALPVEWIGEVARRKTPERGAIDADKAPAPVPGARPTEYWLDRAKALGKAQDWQGLLDCSSQWTRAEPGNPKAWHNLGFAYVKMGRYREAVEAYREALRLKPDDPEAWYNLGVTYRNLGRHQEAIAAYREALRLKPDDADAWYAFGVAYAESGNRSAALEAVRELRRYDPQQAEKLFNAIIRP